jgi:hypothetical protein
MAGLAGLLIAIIILCLIAYLLFYVLNRLALPEPVRTVAIVLVALILLIFIVQKFGLLAAL